MVKTMKPMVYIVDDDPDMRDSLLWLLKTVGLRTATFSSAAEFIRGFTGEGPACLVLDIRMPGTPAAPGSGRAGMTRMRSGVKD